MPLILLVGKIFATSLTIRIGGSMAAIFAPTLFVRGDGGHRVRHRGSRCLPIDHRITLAHTVDRNGRMALGGATRAPITAVVILFELTGEC